MQQFVSGEDRGEAAAAIGTGGGERKRQRRILMLLPVSVAAPISVEVGLRTNNLDY